MVSMLFLTQSNIWIRMAIQSIKDIQCGYNASHKIVTRGLKVLKRSPDIGSQYLNNVKLGQGRPRLII